MQRVAPMPQPYHHPTTKSTPNRKKFKKIAEGLRGPLQRANIQEERHETHRPLPVLQEARVKKVATLRTALKERGARQ